MQKYDTLVDVRGDFFMKKLKEQAIELLQDIPDDKILTVIEILKALKEFYLNENISKTDEPNKDIYTPSCAMGIFNKYANPALIPMEKEAWGEAIKEKHADY